MNNLQIVCINLKRCIDRKNSMINEFSKHNITNYIFFDAIDGSLLDPRDQSLNILKHNVHTMRRHGIAGATLSHFYVWKQLIADVDHEYYIVMEDDVTLCSDFQVHLNKIISQLNHHHLLVYLGTTMTPQNHIRFRSTYIDDTSYSIHALNKNIFVGGAFGYIISKNCAAFLVDHVNNNGLKQVSDMLLFLNVPFIFESHPHLVFTEAVWESDANCQVDSTVQYDFNKISFAKLNNNYLFDDYLFFPNKDSDGGDIKQVCADIPMLKRIADSLDNCVAFNTYGWIKHSICLPQNFVSSDNIYHISDGLYVKKSYFNTHLYLY